MVLQFNHFVLVLCLFYSENKSIENKYSWAQFIQFIFADTCNNNSERFQLWFYTTPKLKQTSHTYYKTAILW